MGGWETAKNAGFKRPTTVCFIFCLFLELILSDHGNGVDKTDEPCVL